MKYPEFQFSAKDIRADTIFDWTGLKTVFKQINVPYSFPSSNGYLRMDSTNQCVIFVDKIDPSIPLMTLDKVYELYVKFRTDMYNFVNNLSVGDKVIIEERRGNDIDYPLDFVDGMTVYCGKEMTIEHIFDGPEENVKFSNGINKRFLMREDSNRYNWSSSMFEMPGLKTIDMISLASLKIDTFQL